MQDHRPLTLVDIISKCFWRMLRPLWFRHMAQYMPPCQVGIGKCCGTGWPIMHSGLFKEAMHASKASWVVTFMDLAGAF